MTTSRPQYVFVLLITLVPLAGSLWASLAGPVQAPIESASALPALAFDQYAVIYMPRDQHRILPAHFDFTNRSEHPVRIVKFIPSCDCLNPTLLDDKKLYAPGERGRFDVYVATARQPAGWKTHTVELVYEEQPASGEAVQRSETLTYRVKLPEQRLSVEPPELFFYQLAGEAGEQSLDVVDGREHPATVLDATCTSNLLTATVGTPATDEHGVQRTPIRVQVREGVPPGRQVVRLQVTTDDPHLSDVIVPILIHGPEK